MRRCADNCDFHLHSLGKLDGDMAEAAETDNTDVEARSVEAEEPHGAVDGDAGTEKRRGGVKRESVGDAKDIALVNDDGVGEAAVGG